MKAYILLLLFSAGCLFGTMTAQDVQNKVAENSNHYSDTITFKDVESEGFYKIVSKGSKIGVTIRDTMYFVIQEYDSLYLPAYTERVEHYTIDTVYVTSSENHTPKRAKNNSYLYLLILTMVGVSGLIIFSIFQGSN